MYSLTKVWGERYNSNLGDVLNNGLLFLSVIVLILDWNGFKFPTIFFVGLIRILLSFSFIVLSFTENLITLIISKPYIVEPTNILPVFSKE